MYARVARYRIEPDRCDEAVESFRAAGAELAGLDGFDGGYVFIDSEGGEVLTATVWKTRNALDASEMRATSIRRGAITAVDGEVDSVTRYDVVVPLDA